LPLVQSRSSEPSLLQWRQASSVPIRSRWQLPTVPIARSLDHLNVPVIERSSWEWPPSDKLPARCRRRPDKAHRRMSCGAVPAALGGVRVSVTVFVRVASALWPGTPQPARTIAAAAAIPAAMRIARRSMRPTSLLDSAARLKGTSDVACPVWPVATLEGELTARRLVITFVPMRRDGVRAVATCRLPYLGVKWSQVQILSARLSARHRSEGVLSLLERYPPGVSAPTDAPTRKTTRPGRPVACLPSEDRQNRRSSDKYRISRVDASWFKPGEIGHRLRLIEPTLIGVADFYDPILL
jgi:hypothetical protein